MSPFDLKGPAFLELYAVVFFAAVAVAALLRWALRTPEPDPWQEPPDLGPYEVAYLGGGQRLALNAALARLVHRGVLTVSHSYTYLSVREKLPAGADPLEQRLCGDLPVGESRTVAEFQARAASYPTRIKKRLLEHGLLVSEGQGAVARWLPLALVLAVAVFGLVKVVVGLERHKPAGFLVAACVGTALVAMIGFGRPVLRSRRGDRVLAELKRKHAALEATAQRRPAGLSDADMILAVGLFGVGILTVGPLADLRATLRPPTGSGGGCGSGCGSGGGCGGGGGGCGGGGCGGCGGG
jgi:uncharacterized protein (TIGR04222 family)